MKVVRSQPFKAAWCTVAVGDVVQFDNGIVGIKISESEYLNAETNNLCDIRIDGSEMLAVFDAELHLKEKF